MRKQDEPFFAQDGSILMKHEGKRPRTEGGGHGVVEGVSRGLWRVRFLHIRPQRRKGIRDRFSGNPALLCPDACFPSMSTSLRDLCVPLCRFPSCDGGTSEGDRRWRRAASESPVRSEIGPYQHRHKARVGLAAKLVLDATLQLAFRWAPFPSTLSSSRRSGSESRWLL